MSSVVYNVHASSRAKPPEELSNLLPPSAGRAAPAARERQFDIGVMPERCAAPAVATCSGRYTDEQVISEQTLFDRYPETLTTHVYKVLLRPVFLVTSRKASRSVASRWIIPIALRRDWNNASGRHRPAMREFLRVLIPMFLCGRFHHAETRCGAASAAWRQVASGAVLVLLVNLSRCKFVNACNRTGQACAMQTPATHHLRHRRLTRSHHAYPPSYARLSGSPNVLCIV